MAIERNSVDNNLFTGRIYLYLRSQKFRNIRDAVLAAYSPMKVH